MSLVGTTWTLEGDRPSVALLEPEKLGVAVNGDGSYGCRFLWQEGYHDLPLLDWRLLGRLTLDRCGARQLHQALGHPADRLVVALTPPMQGYCYKAVVGVLPKK